MGARRKPAHALLALLFVTPLGAAPDFQRDIRPIFEAHCLKCHGPAEQNGGLRYDQPTGALAQGDSGRHALVPGKPEQSELLKRVTATHKSDRMPPKGEPLSLPQVALLREWIAAGAPWPAEPVVADEAPATSTHWAFQPVVEPAIPAVRDPAWPLNPIDHFIQAKREAAGLTPAPDAEPQALMRRLSYALTGLPPAWIWQ